MWFGPDEEFWLCIQTACLDDRKFSEWPRAGRFVHHVVENGEVRKTHSHRSRLRRVEAQLTHHLRQVDDGFSGAPGWIPERRMPRPGADRYQLNPRPDALEIVREVAINEMVVSPARFGRKERPSGNEADYIQPLEASREAPRCLVDHGPD